ncbi:hypothetical protein [Photobacterium halotolerans]|uniref:hypothetical protein n=1 Tax=Photobacterium halotolerans TaxID=265726 RepID=UPI00041D99FA|nr:hypothetical protein [Photobacterium halotolerans]
MLSNYNSLPNDEKARIVRAFLSLKRSDDFEILHSFLLSAEQETLRDLAVMPLEHIPQGQGKAQTLEGFIALLDLATEEELYTLRENR